jgi:hypothetical protein
MFFGSLGDFLAQLTGSSDKDFSNWTQVCQLKPEEKLAHRALIADGVSLNKEAELLIRKAIHLNEQVSLLKDEFWAKVRKEHQLPMNGNFHMTDDGRILMEPKK